MPPSLSLRYAPAARAALARFGVEPATLELHQVSENVTFRVADAQGKEYVLRLHRPGYRTLAELNSERAWTDSLLEAGFAVPRRHLTPGGSAYVPMDIDAGERRFAGLLEWIPGEPLAVLLRRQLGGQEQDDIAAALGELLARLHTHSSGWAPPAGFQRPHYDVHGLLGDTPHWGRFWEHPDLSEDERRTLSAVRLHLRDLLTRLPRGPDLYGMVHSDLHAENLLIESGTLSAIDFDDAAFGWYYYDIAAALKSFADEAGFEDRRDTLLRAYRGARPLAAHDDELVRGFELIRDLALIGWYADRPEVQSIELAHFARFKDRALRESESLLRI